MMLQLHKKIIFKSNFSIVDIVSNNFSNVILNILDRFTFSKTKLVGLYVIYVKYAVFLEIIFILLNLQ